MKLELTLWQDKRNNSANRKQILFYFLIHFIIIFFFLQIIVCLRLSRIVKISSSLIPSIPLVSTTKG